MDLQDIRKELDQVDNQIIDLYFKRMELCTKIAEYKKTHDTGIFDPKREEEKIASVTSKANNELDKESLSLLFKLLMDQSKKLQKELINK